MNIEKICDILVNSGLLTQEQKQMIIDNKEAQRKKLMKDNPYNFAGNIRAKIKEEISPVQIIASMNFSIPSQPAKTLTEDMIMEKIADAYGYRYMKIDPLKLDPRLISTTISKPFAKRHSVIPIDIKDGILTIAISNPEDKALLEELSRVTGLKINPVVASRTDIQKIITEIYGFSTSVRAAEAQMVQGTDLGNLEQYVRLKKVEEIEADDRHIVNAVEYILRYALDQRASDIHIEPKRDTSLVRFRIDGVLHNIYNIPKVVHPAIVSRIKTMSRLDIAERRRPQDGRFKTEFGGKEVEIRVSTIPVAFGEKVVMRIFDPEMMVHDLTELGFFEEEMQKWLRFISRPNGLILVTGPTGSGKTTTLYSTLNVLCSSELNICTIEDPIEMVMEDLNQIAIQPKIGLTFANALKHVLRQDPDIIMVGEIRDPETAHYAIQAAMTGHLVFSTLHTNDTASSVVRLIDLGVEPFQVASTLIGVVAQRLVRKVCSYCAEDVFLTPQQVELLGIKLAPGEDKKFKVAQGKGCPRCRSTGLLGRTGIFEVLEVTDKIRKLILQNKSSKEIEKEALADGMLSLRDMAIKKLARGITSFSEVLRVTAQEEF